MSDKGTEAGIRICAHCGTGMIEEARFCPRCGRPVRAAEDKKHGRRVLAGIGIAAALGVLAAAVGLVTALQMKNVRSEGGYQLLLYLKSNELMTAGGRKYGPQCISDKYYADREDGTLYGRYADRVEYTEDREYIFYPKRLSGDTYSLYCRRLDGKMPDEEKLDANVYRHIVIPPGRVVYLKGDGRKLFIADRRGKEKLAEEVQDFWAAEDGSRVMWTQGDGPELELYVQDMKTSERTRIDTIDLLVDRSEDLSVLAYRKRDSVYVCRDLDGKKCIADGVAQIYSYPTESGLELYCVREIGSREREILHYGTDAAGGGAASVVKFTGEMLGAVSGGRPLVYYVETDPEGLRVKLIDRESVKEIGGLDMSSAEGLSVYLNDRTGELYILEELGNGTGDLYTCDYKTGGTECKPLAEEVFFVEQSGKDGICYMAKVNSAGDSADLYLNGHRLASDVCPYSLQQEEGSLLYLCGMDQDRETGTLYCWNKGRSIKVADDVAIRSYGIVEGGSIAYLTNYDFRRYRGDLMLFDGRKSIRVDTDVTCVLLKD